MTTKAEQRAALDAAVKEYLTRPQTTKFTRIKRYRASKQRKPWMVITRSGIRRSLRLTDLITEE